MKRIVTLACVGMAAVAIAGLPAANAGTVSREAPVTGLDGPRGLDIGKSGKTVVAEADGTISRAFRHGPKAGTTKKIGEVPGEGFAASVAVSPDDRVWALTGGKLYMWGPAGRRHVVANISRWVADHPDPFDQEGNPEDSNPYDVSATRGRSVLVADAAANAVLRVWRSGRILLIARVKPRTVPMPTEFPDLGIPDLPPPGTPIDSEAVTTSVAQGRGGAIYIGELRGFPGNPETSQIWKVRAGEHHAVCKPNKPHQGDCRRYVDGLTSVVGLDAGGGGALYAAELSKRSWPWIETDPPTPGAEEGSVIRIGANKGMHELSPGKVILPGDVAVAPDRSAWVSGPIFGPGKIMRVH